MSVIFTTLSLPLVVVDAHERNYGRAQDIIVDNYGGPIHFSAAALEEESPYPEVRSAVANTDDPTMPFNTFRVWVVGLIWAILVPGVNQFFFLRSPTIAITQVRLPRVFSCFFFA